MQFGQQVVNTNDDVIREVDQRTPPDLRLADFSYSYWGKIGLVRAQLPMEARDAPLVIKRLTRKEQVSG